MEKTVAWYRDNRWWWERVKSGEFQDYYRRQYGERLERTKNLKPQTPAKRRSPVAPLADRAPDELGC